MNEMMINNSKTWWCYNIFEQYWLIIKSWIEFYISSSWHGLKIDIQKTGSVMFGKNKNNTWPVIKMRSEIIEKVSFKYLDCYFKDNINPNIEI